MGRCRLRVFQPATPLPRIGHATNCPLGTPQSVNLFRYARRGISPSSARPLLAVPAPDISALSAPDYAPDPMMDTFERRGRHGLNTGPFDVDPPERATRIPASSTCRASAEAAPALARALREARNNGEEVVVVDGQESTRV